MVVVAGAVVNEVMTVNESHIEEDVLFAACSARPPHLTYRET